MDLGLVWPAFQDVKFLMLVEQRDASVLVRKFLASTVVACNKLVVIQNWLLSRFLFHVNFDWIKSQNLMLFLMAAKPTEEGLQPH